MYRSASTNCATACPCVTLYNRKQCRSIIFYQKKIIGKSQIVFLEVFYLLFSSATVRQRNMLWFVSYLYHVNDNTIRENKIICFFFRYLVYIIVEMNHLCTWNARAAHVTWGLMSSLYYECGLRNKDDRKILSHCNSKLSVIMGASMSNTWRTGNLF